MASINAIDAIMDCAPTFGTISYIVHFTIPHDPVIKVFEGCGKFTPAPTAIGVGSAEVSAFIQVNLFE